MEINRCIKCGFVKPIYNFVCDDKSYEGFSWDELQEVFDPSQKTYPKAYYAECYLCRTGKDLFRRYTKYTPGERKKYYKKNKKKLIKHSIEYDKNNRIAIGKKKYNKKTTVNPIEHKLIKGLICLRKKKSIIKEVKKD